MPTLKFFIYGKLCFFLFLSFNLKAGKAFLSLGGPWKEKSFLKPLDQGEEKKKRLVTLVKSLKSIFSHLENLQSLRDDKAYWKHCSRDEKIALGRKIQHLKNLWSELKRDLERTKRRSPALEEEEKKAREFLQAFRIKRTLGQIRILRKALAQVFRSRELSASS